MFVQKKVLFRNNISNLFTISITETNITSFNFYFEIVSLIKLMYVEDCFCNIYIYNTPLQQSKTLVHQNAEFSDACISYDNSTYLLLSLAHSVTFVSGYRNAFAKMHPVSDVISI